MAKDAPEDQAQPAEDAEAESPASEQQDERLPPLKQRIPEPPDNRRGRQEWFRKRSGA